MVLNERWTRIENIPKMIGKIMEIYLIFWGNIEFIESYIKFGRNHTDFLNGSEDI